MTCVCGVIFCYKCGKNITTQGYLHYQTTCVLFDGQETAVHNINDFDANNRRLVSV